jgi:hypothetical protein
MQSACNQHAISMQSHRRGKGGRSDAIRGHQRSSEANRDHQRRNQSSSRLRNQRSSEVIRDHQRRNQRSSEVIRGAIRTHLACASLRRGRAHSPWNQTKFW